jgi:hypothetical protein
VSRVRRFLLWTGVDEWRAEAARVELGADGLRASGTQLGANPLPYRLDYELDATGAGLVTRRLGVRSSGEGWERSIELSHDGAGAWRCTAEARGVPGSLPPPGGDMQAVRGALDCDLGRCPLTNTMPVLRHELHREAGEVDFLMAWVSVPDLGVHPSVQRYEHVRIDDSGSVVRYVGEHRDFVGELELDRDGLVVFYPELARRV